MLITGTTVLSLTFAGLSAGVAVLLILEVLVGDAQKKSLADYVLKLWIKLDDSLPKNMKELKTGIHYRSSLRISMVPLAMIGGYFLWEGEYLLVGMTVAGLLFGFCLGEWLLEKAINNVYWFVSLTAFAALIALTAFFLRTQNDPASAEVSVLLVLVVIFVLAMAIFPIWMSALLVRSVVGVLRALELSLRRFAEYPKGPLLAVSVFFGALAALAKLLM